MASTSTLNTWMEELALSLLPPSKRSTDLRKCKDTFIRKIKHHNYGRTNQFAVVEKLAGLEEKFQVLNLDDVAEALYSRRLELSNHEERWLPDVLDLLLHLSHDPVNKTRVENLRGIRPRSQTPPLLKWSDIEADDPINHQDQIWRIPEYSDFSSDDEDLVVSSTDTSPASFRPKGTTVNDHNRIFQLAQPVEDTTSLVKLQASQFWRGSDQLVMVTEKQAIREVLLMLSGFPTSIFSSTKLGIRPIARYRLDHLQASTSGSLLQEAAILGSEIDSIRRWLRIRQDVSVMQLIQSTIKTTLATFDHRLSQMQTEILHQVSPTGVISLLHILQRVRQNSISLNAIVNIIPRLVQNNPITALNVLYDHLDLAYSCCDIEALHTLLPILLSALTFYSRPIDLWLRTGKIDSASGAFFISETSKPRTPATLWRAWFVMPTEDEKLIPSFLKKFVGQIFTVGKTAAFLQCLGRSELEHDEPLGVGPAATETAHLIEDSPMPFSAMFEIILDRHLTSLLAVSTTSLKDILEGHCGLSYLLSAFDYLYLGYDGVLLDAIESRTFDQIDRCLETWNDRFLVVDILADAFADIPSVDIGCLSVQSSYTSSRSMESRRRSVRILAAMTLSYDFAWPIANIITPASIAAYQRIALLLSQVRRAKSILERRAYFHVMQVPLGESPSDQKTAQLVYSVLSLFVKSVYAHFTTCTIQPLTSTLRPRLADSGTVDDLIDMHKTYIDALEHACLCSNRIKPLRDALITILDLCIRFADLVSSPSTAAGGEGDEDFEASSFISARSQKRRRRGTKTAGEGDSDSDDGDDDEFGAGEGYSAFILDSDTSVVQEIVKIREAFYKHVTFLMAGLRGVARSSGELGDGFELLADALDGVTPWKRSAYLSQ